MEGCKPKESTFGNALKGKKMETKKILFLNFDKRDSTQALWINSFLSEEEYKHSLLKSFVELDFQKPEKVRIVIIFLEHEELGSSSYLAQLVENKFFTHLFVVCSYKTQHLRILIEIFINKINALLHIEDNTNKYDYLNFFP